MISRPGSAHGRLWNEAKLAYSFSFFFFIPDWEIHYCAASGGSASAKIKEFLVHNILEVILEYQGRKQSRRHSSF